MTHMRQVSLTFCCALMPCLTPPADDQTKTFACAMAVGGWREEGRRGENDGKINVRKMRLTSAAGMSGIRSL